MAKATPRSRAPCRDCGWPPRARCRATASSNDGLLQLHKFSNALTRQSQELRELLVGERRTFRSALHLHQAACAREHEIRIRFGGRIFDVIEIEHRLPLNY